MDGNSECLKIFKHEEGVKAYSFDKYGTYIDNIESVTGISKERFAPAKLIHSSAIKVVTEENYLIKESVDGLVTNVENILLHMSTADCVPVFFFDSKKSVVGLVHCGRKGCVNGILEETIKVLTETYQCSPSDIKIAIGPCICGKCYEVGKDVYDEFAVCYSEDELHNIFISDDEKTYLLDMKKAIVMQLLGLGINSTNIEDCGVCTFETERYTSYRRATKLDKWDDYVENASAIVLVGR